SRSRGSPWQPRRNSLRNPNPRPRRPRTTVPPLSAVLRSRPEPVPTLTRSMRLQSACSGGTRMPHLTEKSIVYAPPLHAFRDADMDFFLDEEAPHWVAVDSRGAEILGRLDGETSFGALVSWYSARMSFEAGKAWLHV